MSKILLEYKEIPGLVLTEINNLRINPIKYCEKLEKYYKYYDGKKLSLPNELQILTEEGDMALEEAISELRKLKPLEKMKWSNGLAKAAQNHANDIGPKGKVGHEGSNGTNSGERISKFGLWDKVCGENVGFINSNPEDIVFFFIIDDGNPSRGHRKNLTLAPFKNIGIGLEEHSVYQFCIVVNFCADFTDIGNNEDGPKYPEGRAKRLDYIPEFSRVKQDDMNDWPPGAISCRTKTETNTTQFTIVTNTIKIYTMSDGSIKEIVDTNTQQRFSDNLQTIVKRKPDSPEMRHSPPKEIKKKGRIERQSTFHHKQLPGVEEQSLVTNNLIETDDDDDV